MSLTEFLSVCLSFFASFHQASRHYDITKIPASSFRELVDELGMEDICSELWLGCMQEIMELSRSWRDVGVVVREVFLKQMVLALINSDQCGLGGG